MAHFTGHHMVLKLASILSVIYSTHFCPLSGTKDPICTESPTSREFEQAPGVGEGQGKPGVLQSMRLQRVGHDFTPKQQSPASGSKATA